MTALKRMHERILDTGTRMEYPDNDICQIRRRGREVPGTTPGDCWRKGGTGREELKNEHSSRIFKQTGIPARRKGRASARRGRGGQKMSIRTDLFLTFARVGLFTFGGGYAMISLIEDSCVEKKQWITHDEMMDVMVIAESTPGPIAINCATFVGYRQGGMSGALAATAGIVLPSFCIIYLISLFLDSFLEIAWIAHAFQGIKTAVGILILGAALGMIEKMPKKPLPLTVMGCSAFLMLLIDLLAVRVSSITLMLIAGAVSLSLYVLQQRDGRGEGAE